MVSFKQYNDLHIYIIHIKLFVYSQLLKSNLILKGNDRRPVTKKPDEMAIDRFNIEFKDVSLS